MRQGWNTRPLACGLALAVMVAASPGAAAAAAARPTAGAGRAALREADEAAVRALAARLVEAWNGADSRGLADVFAEDGDLIAGDGKLTSGRAAIESYFAHLLETMPRGTRFRLTVTNVRPVAPGVALLNSSGGFLLPGDEDVTPERRGLQVLVAVHDAGAWKATLLQRTRITPPPPAAPAR